MRILSVIVLRPAGGVICIAGLHGKDFGLARWISSNQALLNYIEPLLALKDPKSVWMLCQLRESSFVKRNWRAVECKMIDRTEKFIHGNTELIVVLFVNIISSQSTIEHRFHGLEYTNYDRYVNGEDFFAINTLHVLEALWCVWSDNRLDWRFGKPSIRACCELAKHRDV